MTAPFKTIEGTPDIAGLMHALGAQAKAAARVLALAPARHKDMALAAIAEALRANAFAPSAERTRCGRCDFGRICSAGLAVGNGA